MSCPLVCDRAGALHPGCGSISDTAHRTGCSHSLPDASPGTPPTGVAASDACAFEAGIAVGRNRYPAGAAPPSAMVALETEAHPVAAHQDLPPRAKAAWLLLPSPDTDERLPGQSSNCVRSGPGVIPGQTLNVGLL